MWAPCRWLRIETRIWIVKVENIFSLHMQSSVEITTYPLTRTGSPSALQFGPVWFRFSRSPTHLNELGEPYVKTEVRSRTRIESVDSYAARGVCIEPSGSTNYRTGSHR